MPFKILEVDLAKDYDELFACQVSAWTHPPQAVWELMFPILGDGPHVEAEAIRIGGARQLQGNTPCDRWVKVIDTETGKIIAGALWKFFDSNPYRAPFDEFNAFWYPEGDLRDLCNQMYDQLRAWRPKCMAAPHACKDSSLS